MARPRRRNEQARREEASTQRVFRPQGCESRVGIVALSVRKGETLEETSTHPWVPRGVCSPSHSSSVISRSFAPCGTRRRAWREGCADGSHQLFTEPSSVVPNFDAHVPLTEFKELVELVFGIVCCGYRPDVQQPTRAVASIGEKERATGSRRARLVGSVQGTRALSSRGLPARASQRTAGRSRGGGPIDSEFFADRMK